MKTSSASRGRRSSAAAEERAGRPILDHPVYRGGDFAVGAFRCKASWPCFADTGPTLGHLMVFPRTAVTITHEGGAPIQADATRVMLYNKEQRYRRGLCDPRGDLCEWFSVSAAAIADAARPYDPGVAERPDRPFAFSVGNVDARTYLDQRRLFESLRQRVPTDPLRVEEAILDLLGRVVAAAYRGRGIHPRPQRTMTEAAQVRAVDAARSVLGAAVGRALSLRELADRAGVSPYHLCRIFRRRTGLTLHQYLTQLRVRAALGPLGADVRDLTRLGLDLGYSSHSHFTESFRRAFGMPPARLRELLGGGRARP